MSSIKSDNLSSPKIDDSSDLVKVASDSTPSSDRPDDLQRKLLPRHVQMIAVGGIVGSGYFIGSGAALGSGGPIGLLLGYSFMGIITYSVVVALGEMAAVFPMSGGFVYLANRFVDPALGFACGVNYWYGLAVTLPAEITAGAIVISYWDTNTNVAVWISMFVVVILCSNLISVRVFGEVEFWAAGIKIVTIVGLLLLLLIIDLGGAPTRDRLGLRYWLDPGPFAQLYNIPGAKGRFLAFFSTFLNAAFSYGGVEVIALTAAESQSPHKTIPRAVKTVFWRILILYVGGVFLMGLTVPYTNDLLLDDSGTATASPFIIAIQLAAIPILPSIINAVILLSTFSAGNSYLYAASRTLFGLACDNQAPAIFRRVTKGGLPWVAVSGTALFTLLAYMNVSNNGATVFNWFYTLSAISCLLTWFAIMVTYLRFYAGLQHHGISRAHLPYTAPFQPFLTWFGLIFICVIVLFNGFTIFLEETFDISYFISSYAAVVVFAGFLIFWKFHKKTVFITLEAMDFTGLVEACAHADEENHGGVESRWSAKKGPVNRTIGWLSNAWE